MNRIVLVTLGSLGDLHPYLAVGAALAARGHAVTVATHVAHRPAVEAAGLRFAPVRPDLAAFGDLDTTMRRAMDLRGGSVFVLREMVLANVRATAEDLLAACAGADLVMSHVIALAAAPVTEKLGIPRVHAALQPMTMYSAYDRPNLPWAPGVTWFARALPPAARAVARAALETASRPLFAPIDALRRDLGLPRSRVHPLTGLWSSWLNLALFSPRFGPPRPDWPAHTIATGFPAWTPGEGWDEELQAFLEEGEPPVVFTLGSSAVYAADGFYVESAKAAAALGVRAVLLTGPEGRNALPPGLLDRRIRAFPVAPHALLFPRAAAIVHQGGIGTTARALESGRPMLVVPHSHDQPDNADRCARLGVARVVGRGRYRVARAVRELRALLADAPLRSRAAALGEAVRAEDGAGTAADAIESCLRGPLAGAPGPA